MQKLFGIKLFITKSETTRLIQNILLFIFVFILTPAICQINEEQQELQRQFVTLKGPEGNITQLVAADDDDGDGILNILEVNGFTYDVINGLQEWNGDPNTKYFKTDALRWSTDGDPYSDYMEVTGINMPSAISAPENHPLVAARPIINIKMEDYDVIPIETITDTKGGEQSSSFTNEVSNSNTVSAEVTVSAELNPFKLASASVTAGYSHTWTSTQSSTSSFGTNWSNTRSSSPNEAAELRLRIYMENHGGATALDVQPTINLKLGKKTIATFIPGQIANILTPPGTTNNRFPANGTIVVSEDQNANKLIISLDDLKAIQAGTPLSLEVIQVSAKVVRWNSTDQDWNSDIDWAGFESDIDPVSVEIRAELGDGENYRYQVFAGTQYWDPGYTLKDIISLIFDVDKVNSQDYIEQREYPDKWYLSSPSTAIISAWNNAGQPQNMFDVPISKSTQLVMMSPGSNPGSIINLATYSGDFKKVLVSAIPNNFPILSVKAEVPVNGVMQTFTLKQNNNSFFVNDTLIDGVPDGPGTVYVTNARGDVSSATIQLPSYFTSAKDVKDFSSFIPNPGGDFWLFPNEESDPLLFYCLFYDLKTDAELDVPKEYVSLKNDVLENNFSEQTYQDGYGRASFSKLRINPSTLKLDLKDLNFMTVDVSSGGSFNENNFKPGNIFYGYPDQDSINASLDLSGTPYSISPYAEQKISGANISIDNKRQKFTINRGNLTSLSETAGTYQGLGNDSLQLVYNYEGIILKNRPTENDMALSFNEANLDGYVNVGDSDSLKISGNFTVEAWIYPTGNGGSAGGIIFSREGEYEFARLGDGFIQIAIKNSAQTWFWNNTMYFAPENVWSHIALVYNQIDIKAYINGVLFSVIPSNGPLSDQHPAENEFRIGNRQRGGQPFVGLIDEVRLWNRALSETQIKQTYFSRLPENYYASADSGLRGYWNFDQIIDVGDSSFVEDLSVNGNNGLLSGDVSASEILTEISISSAKIPEQYSLNQNYPNPFNPTTIIKYGLKKAAKINLAIYNIMGQKVKTLVSDFQNAGTKTIQWNGQNDFNRQVSSGTYIYTMSVNDKLVFSKKMVLIR